MAMLKRLNSDYGDNSLSDKAGEGALFISWQQVFEYLKIDYTEIPWNADGAEALEILRKKYGAMHNVLSNSLFDDAVRTYRGRGYGEQLQALGTAAQMLGMCLLHIRIENSSGYYYMDTVDGIKDLMTESDSLGKRLSKMIRRKYSIIKLDNERLLQNPEKDIQIPVSSIQMHDIHVHTSYVLDHFLVVPHETFENNNPTPSTLLYIYDLRYWPLRELKNEVTYHHEHIYPYTLKIETEYGEKFYYVGQSINYSKCLHKAVLLDNGECILDEDNQEDDDSLMEIVKIGDNSLEIQSAIPTINDTRPQMIVDNCIVYEYLNNDIDHRDSDKLNTSSMNPHLRGYVFSRNRATTTFLEYNPSTKKYRKMEIPWAGHVWDWIVYKNTWIILPFNNRSRHRTSYLLRLWNPRTNECLRLTHQDMGNHNIEYIYPMPNGDIMFLLDDGRLCHLDVDLVSWLKQDLHSHHVPLDAWVEESHRSYENFPDLSDESPRIRSDEADDRMLITFTDGKTYDILITKNRIKK